jgi:hypothetical protein
LSLSEFMEELGFNLPEFRWIQGAIRREGSLRRFAERHRLLNKEGNIDLNKVRRYVKRELKGSARKLRERQVNLAQTLRRLRRE